MDTSVSLQQNFGFAYANTLVLGTVLVLLILAPFLLAKLRKKRPVKAAADEPLQTRPEKPQAYDARAAYLKKLADLSKEWEQDKISSRECFLRLSGLSRSYAQEKTGIDVTTKTLLEIHMMKMPQLEALLEEYYEAEFGPGGGACAADPGAAIEKTKKVIETWK